MIKKFNDIPILAGIYFLLGFPIFYFVYKYSVPYFGTTDFFDYYKLYENMDYHGADSPLNMRLFGSFFVYLLNKTGLVYDTQTNIDGESFSKSIYFNAILLNFMWVVATCVFLYKLVRYRGQSILVSFAAGASYLLGFGTIFYEVMPLADAPAVFLFTWVLWCYFKKSNYIIVPLLILIFQREYIFLALGFLALIEYLRHKDKYFVKVLIYSIVCFGTYVVLRKLFFETPRYSHHTNLGYAAESVVTLRFPVLPFLRQTIMTMNISIIYILIVFYKMRNKISFNKPAFVNFILLFLQIVVIAFLLALGNNTGRYFYILVPLVIIYLTDEVKGLDILKN